MLRLASHPSRRQFLTAGGVAAALAAWPRASDAAGLTDNEAANIRLVTEFCAAWPSRDVTKLSPFFTDTAVYRVSETSPPNVGRDAVLARIKPMLDNADTVELKITNSLALGPLVLNDRIDRFEGPKRHWRFHVAGMFFLKDGRIQEWTDYLIRD
jgi:limonene-1,2-epoxide hydrolase